MNFVADEGVERQIIEALVREGHDVLAIRDHLPGKEDDRVLSIASTDHRILLTCDKDFGELVYRLGQASSGVMLIRLAGLSNLAKANIVRYAVSTHGADLPDAFTVIEPGHIRIRRHSG